MADQLRGIDVASFQGNPNWGAVAADGISFAFTKATQGVGYLNPTFTRNWSEMKRVNIVRGAYHFAEPNENTATAEADYFLSNVERLGIETGDMLALDLEPTVKVPKLGEWALAFLECVKARAGFDPLVYTGAWVVADQNLANYPALGQFPLWLAAYQSSMPPTPPPWSMWSAGIAFWQYSDAGSVNGISGAVDLDRFNGAPSEISHYGKPSAQVPVPSPYAVGPGVLAAMTARGEQPATSEVYVKAGAADQFSEAFDMAGSRYVYIASTNKVHRFDPS